MLHIEHIGIAVEDLERANILYSKLLGVEHYKIDEVESEGVRTSFFMAGESKIELLEATGADSPIASFIAKRGPGIHHIAYAVPDIHAAMEKAREDGFTLINETPKRGADNKLVCFLHPKSTGGVLVEFCQDVPAEYNR